MTKNLVEIFKILIKKYLHKWRLCQELFCNHFVSLVLDSRTHDHTHDLLKRKQLHCLPFLAQWIKTIVWFWIRNMYPPTLSYMGNTNLEKRSSGDQTVCLPKSQQKGWTGNGRRCWWSGSVCLDCTPAGLVALFVEMLSEHQTWQKRCVNVYYLYTNW